MTPELERTLADIAVLEPLFETDGWRKLVESLAEEVEVIKEDLLRARTERDSAFLQGRAQQCVSIASLEDYLFNQKQQIMLAEEEDNEHGNVRL